MKAAGYVRVSTEEQAREGYGLAAQEQAVKAYCQAHSWELAEVYTDAGKSGKSTKGREELARLLSDAQAGRFQRVVFWKLDRLGRNLRDLLDICDQLDALGVGIVSVQEAIDTGTPGGRMMRSVLGALAEFERSLIIERTKAGMAAAKRRGKHVGRPPALSSEQIAHARASIANGETIGGMAEILKVNRKTLSRALKSGSA